MMRPCRITRLALALLALVAAFVATTAVAQDGVLRAGVAPDAITPSGMTLADVRVPSEPGHPVRLAFAPADNSPIELLLDVRVAPDVERAREALRWRRRTVAGPAAPVDGIGDEAFGSEGLLVSRRDNVVVALLRVRGERDVASIARRIDRAVLQAPTGAPQAARVDVTLPRELQRGVSEPVRIEGDVLAASVQVSGAAYGRRTRDGWVVTRTRDGSWDARVVYVDRLLRTGVR